MTTLLVDGDILVYKAAFAAEEVYAFDEDVWASTANIRSAQDRFREILDNLKRSTKATSTVICLTGSGNWRRELYPPYKAPRGKVRRPILLKPLREWVEEMALHDNTAVYVKYRLEADDVLGILATHPRLIKGPKVIASIDKDLLQIPGDHLNIDKGDRLTVTEHSGDYWHMCQTLTGDAVDNFPGLPGCGPVKAARILGDPAEFGDHVDPWALVRGAYEAKGLTEADALLQARVARICRHTDYDFKTKEVKLWTPPGVNMVA